jgi:hypothetical protein
MKNLVTVPKIFFSIDLKPPLLLPGEFLKKALPSMSAGFL